MLAINRSSLKLSQSLSISCLLISELDFNANCLSFALKCTVKSIIKLFSTADLI